MPRTRVVFVFIVLLFVCVVARLFQIQIVYGSKYRKEAANQHFIERIVPAARGNIISDDGKFLAINTPSYLVYAEPRLIQDKTKFIRTIESVLHIDTMFIKSKLEDPKSLWVPIQGGVSAEVADKLSLSGVKGLGFDEEYTRFYPEASMAAHLLGFVGRDEKGSPKGYFGVEGYYDREIRGKDGYERIERDVNGNPILVGGSERVNAQNGRTLRLYLDRTVQYFTERHLKNGIEKYGAKAGTVTVYDPKTGGIIALATYPTYDPVNYSKYPGDIYKNPVVASSYEPGSTFKVLIMAAGINEHVLSAETIMEETGPVKIGEYFIRTWNNKYLGNLTMTDVLVHSSNVGMVFVGRKLGAKKLLEYLHGYGFGDVTGSDLEEETSPDLRPDTEWKEIDLATTSFGQGIAVTPMQMVRAVGAIANDGNLMEPHAVKEIITSDGKIIPIQPKRIRQIIKPSVAKTLTEMMVETVEKGEAKWAKPKGYRIAGKTGTAQIPIAGHYDETKTIASFVGFAPADNPKFVILVTLHEPSSSPWGSETAAPLFFSLAKDLFSYYRIAPN